MKDQNYDIIEEDLDKNSKITIKSNNQLDQLGNLGNLEQSNSSKEDPNKSNYFLLN